MDLAVNQLFQRCDEEERIERILWIDTEGRHLVTIDVGDEKAWPSIVDFSFFERHISSGDIRLLNSDLYGHLRQPDSVFSPSCIKQRDEAWKIIEDIVAPQAAEGREGQGDGAIFHPYVLGPIIQAVAARTGSSKRWVRACLRRYWQRGQTKNALIPQSDRHSTRGKGRKSPDRHGPKRGRPSMAAKHTGAVTGINIDETIKENFRRGTQLYDENAEKTSMIGAFRHILALFFHQGMELRNGMFFPLMPPANELPTWNQYRHWYRTEHDLTRSIAAREGPDARDAGERAALEDPRQEILAPGRQFEIHVAIGAIYLVSTLDRRRILGRPIIYIIVDVFSGLIVGIYVSLEGPNPAGAMLAIENMARDKVAYCRGYGFDISEDDWPCHHLPKTMLASRSELLIENAGALVDTLGIEISNEQPCRLDWRESFERCIPLCYDMTIHSAQGSVNSLSEPGRKGHRLDGCLTLNEFNRLVIKCILEHNMAHPLSDDYLDGDMIADSVEPYPRDLWKWGVQNRSGALHKLPADTVRRNLLPHGNASVTSQGICFKRVLYTCDEAVLEQWFEQANRGKRGSLSVPIVYDPSVVDQIYVCLPGDLPLNACKLLEKDQIEFKGCAWFEVEELVTRFMREVRENRAAERLQEREANVWDFQGQESAGAGPSHLTFKGLAERIFASNSDKLSPLSCPAAFVLERCEGPENQ